MRTFLSLSLSCLLLLSSAAFAASPADADAENEAWKKEPAYGRTIKVGYSGGLCTGTFGIAQMKGFYEAEGLTTEVVRRPAATRKPTPSVRARWTWRAAISLPCSFRR